MKHSRLLLLVTGLLAACGGSEQKKDKPTEVIASTADSVGAAPKRQNCQSIIGAERLGKANEYQESAKPLKVTITLEQDTSATQTTKGCYFNNMVTVLATKKSGSRVFKRTLTKDDLVYFTKNDTPIEEAVLQNTLYKPTFNGQKYITLTMRLMEPVSKKTSDYTVYMNYFGEIVKVR
ncbi:hypothetical protein M0L20_17320 [Spirosoma sp. RP8]|uniref:Lipoprotein n=1 Tax=Spirosoma liriopis TaxID=2937440 RepID=A0ABT0HNT0_9BACT|nr:hypothetical protein [Spirosoma liriopis]MCK8493630.1 hypothetical protein [Spirosoma liriopis]